MKLFQEMLRKIVASPYHNQMMRFVVPLNDHFGVNHFWYYRVTYSGYYCFLGTHTSWSEYCFEHHLVDYFPCLRHPDTLQSGINLMKKSSSLDYKNVLKMAWEKFNINFNIQLLKKVPEGVEGFGFATRFNHQASDERLLNELPLLRHFIHAFREKHQPLFDLLYDQQVNLSSYLGPMFNEKRKSLKLPHDRVTFLEKIGFKSILSLTAREKDVFKFISHGYPASYIAEQLQLSSKTIENYIAAIKSKLFCHSKVELIQKAQLLDSIGYFDFDY